MDSAESLPYCVTKEILYSFLFFVDASWEWLEGGCSISPIVRYSDPPIWGSYRWCCLSCKRKRTFPETSDIKLYPSPHPIVQYPCGSNLDCCLFWLWSHFLKSFPYSLFLLIKNPWPDYVVMLLRTMSLLFLINWTKKKFWKHIWYTVVNTWPDPSMCN